MHSIFDDISHSLPKLNSYVLVNLTPVSYVVVSLHKFKRIYLNELTDATVYSASFKTN